MHLFLQFCRRLIHMWQTTKNISICFCCIYIINRLRCTIVMKLQWRFVKYIIYFSAKTRMKFVLQTKIYLYYSKECRIRYGTFLLITCRINRFFYLWCLITPFVTSNFSECFLTFLNHLQCNVCIFRLNHHCSSHYLVFKGRNYIQSIT